MLSIAKTTNKPIPYPEYVIEKNCDCYSFISQQGKTINVRTSLVIKTDKNSNKIVTYILKNPSKANEYESDLTINKVIKAAYKQGASKIFIFNVLPFYLTDSNQLIAFVKKLKRNESSDYDNAVSKNLDVIKNYLATSTEDEFVCAWGSNPTDKGNLKNIISAIKQHRVQVKKIKLEDNFPVHPQGKPIDMKNPFEPLNL
ncbi:DUF1643 domain-containing protein [Bacillus safensis]|uniref:DUF1643 domain-containing protein n=1 Tax=Bacillus safensis TaxID=561879 RepID=UPI000407D60D|nr:DUF1643 domain-containing protein [Bacillus safensis]